MARREEISSVPEIAVAQPGKTDPQADAGFREQKEMERQFHEKHETEEKKSDRSFRVIEIHTSLGISFTIASATPLQPLYGMLQLERVRCIYQIEGVSVKAVMGQERWLIFQVLVLYYVTCIEYKV